MVRCYHIVQRALFPTFSRTAYAVTHRTHAGRTFRRRSHARSKGGLRHKAANPPCHSVAVFGSENQDIAQSVVDRFQQRRRLVVPSWALAKVWRASSTRPSSTAAAACSVRVKASVSARVPEARHAFDAPPALKGRPGVLIVREADASWGGRFQATRLIERCCAWLREEGRQSYCYRTSAEWLGVIEGLGLSVTAVRPMHRGTPFANVLIAARRAALSRCARLSP
jgi:hypothetical protein